jgi:hypothetical protein
MILLATDHYGLRLVVALGIGIEKSGLGVKPRFWVGTHIHRAVQSWLQKSDIKTKLVLIGSASGVI